MPRVFQLPRYLFRQLTQLFNRPAQPATAPAHPSSRLIVNGAIVAILLIVTGIAALTIDTLSHSPGDNTDLNDDPADFSDLLPFQFGDQADVRPLPDFLATLPGGAEVQVEIAPSIDMTFCWVPPGAATLGSPATEKGRSPKEKEHQYTARGFWLGKYPVTQQQWQALMGANPSFFQPHEINIKQAGITDTSRFPVEQVAAVDTKQRDHSIEAFLETMNSSIKTPAAMGPGKFVLPNENDWEYACRGGLGNQQPYYFGDKLNGDRANCNGTEPYGTNVKGVRKSRTTQVGNYEKVAPHPWGLCDMHGNVFQWCEKAHPRNNGRLSLCGGSFQSEATYCRAAYRGWDNSFDHCVTIGCRVCFRLD